MKLALEKLNGTIIAYKNSPNFNGMTKITHMMLVAMSNILGYDLPIAR